MTAMCWPWCTHMTWRLSSLPARTPPSECIGTTSGSLSHLSCFSPPLSCFSPPFYTFSLCLSVPAFFCLLTGYCLASIVSACLLVCLVLASVPFWLADGSSLSVCLSVCLSDLLTCLSLCVCMSDGLFVWWLCIHHVVCQAIQVPARPCYCAVALSLAWM